MKREHKESKLRSLYHTDEQINQFDQLIDKHDFKEQNRFEGTFH